MREARSNRDRLLDSLGWACLVASLLLLSIGVRAVRAGDEDPAALVSVDPAWVEALKRNEIEAAPAAPAPSPRPSVSRRAAEEPRQPRLPIVEPDPEVIVLNNSGYYYGPPPTTRLPPALRTGTHPD